MSPGIRRISFLSLMILTISAAPICQEPLRAEEEGLSLEATADLEAKMKKIEQERIKQYRFMGKLYTEGKQYEKAISTYEKALKLAPNDVDLHNNLAKLYHRQQRYNKALTEYLKLIKLNPNRQDQYYKNLGYIYTRIGNKEKAIEMGKKVVELNPTRAYAHSTLAGIYQENEMYDEAIAAYRKVTEMEPGRSDYRLQLARCYRAAGLYEEAAKEYNKTTESTGNRNRWARERAKKELFDMYKKQDMLDKMAEEKKANLSQIEEESLKLYKSLGKAYSRKKEYEKAIEMYKKALGVTPEDVSLRLTLANLYDENNMLKESLTEYEEVIKLSPGTKEAEKARRQINILKENQGE